MFLNVQMTIQEKSNCQPIFFTPTLFLFVRMIFSIYISCFCMVSESANQSTYGSSWIAKKGNSEVFLLGVTHVGLLTQYPVPEQVRERFKNADIYIAESSSSFMDEASLIQNWLKWTELKDDLSFGKLIEHNDQDKGGQCVQNFLKNIKNVKTNKTINKEFFSDKSPAVIFALLYEGSSDGSFNAKQKFKSLETLLFQVAKNSQKKTATFDPEYFESFHELSYPAQILLLKDTCLRSQSNEMREIKSSLYEKLEEMWSKGSPDQNYQDLLDMSSLNSTHKKYLDEWFSNRNKRMLAITLENVKESNRIFIALGLAHLGGEHGLLQLLKNNGYSISQF
jgi:uncharacterized protein YbaP (TraB family)